MKEGTMANPTPGPQPSDARGEGEYDAIVIGAGFGGLYALHHLRDKMGQCQWPIGSSE
jgi:chemotaxis response regulator CheB